MKNLKLKKSLSILLSIIMIITTCAISFGVSAEDETTTYAGLEATASGECTGSSTYDDVADGDDSVQWAYYQDIKTLVISGTGAMVSYTKDSTTSIFGLDRPWYDYITEIETVIVEEGVTGTGTYAFRGCTALTSISLPSSLVYIGAHLVFGCTSLKSIIIPEGVTTIGAAIFRSCTALEVISLPASITALGNSQTVDCGSLLLVAYAGSDWSATNYTGNTAGNSYPDFIDFNATTTDTSDDNVVTNLSLNTAYAIADSDITWSLSEDLTLTISGEGAMPDNTDTNGDGSIGGDDSPWYDLLGCLKALVIEEGITSIGYYNFRGTASYSTLSLPTTLVTIGDYAFQGQKLNLTSLNIPEGVTSIGEYAFRYSNALNTIYLPSTLESIGECALDASNDMYLNTTLYYAGTEAELSALTTGVTNAIDPDLTDYVYNHVCSGSYASTLSSPTCTETGIDLYACSTCGTNYQVVVAIDSNAHTYDSGTVTAPTCTEEGFTTYTCECGHFYVDETSYVNATGHSYEAEDYTAPTDTTLDSYTAPTYTVDGYWTVECTNDECTVTETFDKDGSATAHAQEDLAAAKSAIEALTFTTDEADMKSQIDAIVAEYTDGMTATVETVIDPEATTMADGTMTYTVTLTAGTQTATVTETATVAEIAVTQDQLDAVADDIEAAVKAEVTYSADTVDSNIEAAAKTVIAASIDSTISASDVDASVTTAAKCEATGTYTYTITLTVDGLTSTATGTLEIAATGHTSEDVAAKAATCTEDGYTAGTKCSVCDEILTGCETIEAAHTGKLESETIQPTCTENGYTYSYYTCCGDAEAAQEAAYAAAQADENISADMAATGHTFSAAGLAETAEDGYTPATATSEGYWTVTCSVEGCGAVGTVVDAGSMQEYLDSLDDEAKEVAAKLAAEVAAVEAAIADLEITATEETDLTSTLSGAAVGAITTDGITPSVEATAYTAATCSQVGSYSYTVTLTYSDQTATTSGTLELAKVAHTLIDVPAVTATCGTAGATAGKYCTVCQKTIEGCEEIAATGHSFDATDYVAPTDTTASNYTPATTESDGYWTVTCTNTDCSEEKIIYNVGSKEEEPEVIDYAAELAAAVEAVEDFDFELTTDLTEDTVEAAIIAELEAIVGEYVTVSLENVVFTPAVEGQEATDDQEEIIGSSASVTFDVVLSAQDQTDETITFADITLEEDPTVEEETSSHFVQCDGLFCTCICASDSAFVQFIAKIAIFFWKLFGINQYCTSFGCNGVHY